MIVVEYLSSVGLTQTTRQVSVDSLKKKCFGVCPYAPIRADSSGHTRIFCLQSLFSGNQGLHTHCSASLDTKWAFSLCYTPDNRRVHNTLLSLRSPACGLYTILCMACVIGIYLALCDISDWETRTIKKKINKVDIKWDKNCLKQWTVC